MLDFLARFLLIVGLVCRLVGAQISPKDNHLQHSVCVGHQTVNASIVRGHQVKLATAPFRRSIGSDAFYHLNPQYWAEFDTQNADIDSKWDGTNQRVVIQLYGIEVDGRVLNGWLHVVVKSALSFGILKMSGVGDYLPQMGLEHNLQQGGIGEFVHGFPTCQGHETVDQLQSIYQYMPCGGAHQGLQTVPWGFQYVRPTSSIKNSPLSPPQHPTGKENGIHTNFRIGTQNCNYISDLTMHNIMFVEGVGNRVGHADLLYFVQAHFIGATDPVPRPGTYDKITCSKRMYQYKTGQGNHDIRYIAPRTPTTPFLGFLHQYQCSNTPTFSFFEDQVKANLFGGRCLRELNYTNWQASRKLTNLCRANYEVIDPSTGAIALDYDKYILELTKGVANLCGDCPTLPPRPNTPITTLAPGEIADMLMADIRIEKRGVELSHPYALELWDTRIIHGICMTMLAIFVSPVNVFITRYFKETFKDKRILLLEVWYFLHHISIGVYFFLYGVGMYRLIDRKKLLGVSLCKSAVVHRALGWTCIFITTLLVLLGGFRTMNRCIRTFCIAAHWTLGMLVYFAGYVGIITAVWIPGSPAATSDTSLLLSDFQTQYVVVLVLFWIVFDIVMHALMTVHMCKMDKKLALTRPRYYFPSPITVLKEHETEDLPGAKFRKLMLIVYSSVSLLLAVVICGTIRYTSVTGRALGQMSCSHSGLGEPLLMVYGGDCD